MSLSHETMLDLMAYADGEADAEVTARVEKLVAESAEARDFVAAMVGAVAEVAAFVARESDAHAARAGADTIANAVMNAVSTAGPAANVASLDAARGRRDARGRAALIVAAMVAIAAGVFFYVRSTSDSGPSVSPMANIAPSEAVPASASAGGQEGGPEGVMANAEPPEVTIKSTTSHDVSVLVVPAVQAAANANGNPASVIVWVGDNPGGKN
jgi:hypothetical protein